MRIPSYSNEEQIPKLFVWRHLWTPQKHAAPRRQPYRKQPEFAMSLTLFYAPDAKTGVYLENLFGIFLENPSEYFLENLFYYLFINPGFIYVL